jgi:hypothetical protein
MFRQPMKRAPGATPTWLPAPSSPTARLAVDVPWPWSSQGAAAFEPQGLPAAASWTASCQL